MSADYPFPGYQEQQKNRTKAKKEFPQLAAVPSVGIADNYPKIARCLGLFPLAEVMDFPGSKSMDK